MVLLRCYRLVVGENTNNGKKSINRRYDRIGQLFQHRFGRKEVTSDAYFTRIVFYIHFNPQHHSLINEFSRWPHSSYHSMLSESKTALQREEVLEWFGDREKYKVFHEEIAADFTSIGPLIDDDEVQ